ncbi:DUF433 domain-containing protein, partial [uncultured Nostoc sp.]|uniref:DUF433 domain-containing protein n=1 Tax=uncultured Nostoc sp. TaxID=340711 RepID=UPI0035CBF148
ATDLRVVATDLRVVATDLRVVATDLGEVASVFLMQSRFATIKAMNLKALMTLAIIAEPAPLRSNKDGVVLVGNTRVTLDTIAAVFKQGATAEEIVYRYPSLNLADVYATIAFYLNHQAEVEAYLQQRQQQSQEIRAMNQARFDPQGLRDRLLARKTAPEAC